MTHSQTEPFFTPVPFDAASLRLPRRVIASKQGQRVFPRLTEACRLIAREAPRHRTNAAADAAALAAYADELLPIILGGRWQRSHVAVPRGGDGRYIDAHALFDDRLVFRRAGTRGRLTWQHAAVIGMPYGALDPIDRLPADQATAAASHLADSGVGVWARVDLSCWFPGNSQLVIAAPGLLDRDPAEFGFQTVNPNEGV